MTNFKIGLNASALIVSGYNFAIVGRYQTPNQLLLLPSSDCAYTCGQKAGRKFF